MRIKKGIIATAIPLSFLLYVLSQRQDASPTTSPAPAVVPIAIPTVTQPDRAPTTPTAQTYADGTFIGTVADALYGPLQVKAVISRGKITQVVFLQYPNDRQNSIIINTQAMPILSSEAIAAQSASVDVVSGATTSSEAFQESLSIALASARKK